MSSNRYAVLIGCNYNGTSNQLYGCQNDVIKYKPILINNYGYKSENIIMLMDTDGYEFPTLDNIVKYMNWLIQKSNEADELTFYYSGHGSNLRDVSKDEPDKMDECIVPLDFEKKGFITDDYIYLNFLSKLKPVKKIICVFDSCNSASCTDLPYSFTWANRRVTKLSYSKRNPISNNPNIFVLSGCLDPKYSLDTSEPDKTPCGLLSYWLRQTLISCNYNANVGDLVCRIKAGFGLNDQTPVVSVNSNKYTPTTIVFTPWVQPVQQPPNNKPTNNKPTNNRQQHRTPTQLTNYDLFNNKENKLNKLKKNKSKKNKSHKSFNFTDKNINKQFTNEIKEFVKTIKNLIN